jgi:hypothetical protein
VGEIGDFNTINHQRLLLEYCYLYMITYSKRLTPVRYLYPYIRYGPRRGGKGSYLTAGVTGKGGTGKIHIILMPLLANCAGFQAAEPLSAGAGVGRR